MSAYRPGCHCVTCRVAPLTLGLGGQCQLCYETRVRNERRRRFDTHTVWADDDNQADIPNEIKDRNGNVVLGLCKVCGAAEEELLDRVCNPPQYVSHGTWQIPAGVRQADVRIDKGSPRGDITMYQGVGAPPEQDGFRAGDIYYDIHENLLYLHSGLGWLLHHKSYQDLQPLEKLNAKTIQREKINTLPAVKPRRIIDLGD